MRTLLFALSMFLFGLIGCAVGPDYSPPIVEMPDAWHQELGRGLSGDDSDIQNWWVLLNDPILNRLIVRASSGNLDLKEAFSRVMEARAQRGVAAADWAPQLDGYGVFERTRPSESTVPLVRSRNDEFLATGLDATWELDLWGRIRRSVESASASYDATIEAYRDTLVFLYAEVALTYIEVRTLQARIEAARGNATAQQAAVELTQGRFDAEIVSELDVRQAELNLASTESVIPALEILLARSLHRLSVLVGEGPGSLSEELQPGPPIPTAPEEIAIGLPLDLVRQRPDVRQAEREIAAQTALIGVATADLYPRFTLSGAFAYETSQSTFKDLFTGKNRAWSFGPAFRWNILDGARIRNNILVQRAATSGAWRRYENKLLLALEEVENAIVRFVKESDRRDLLAAAVAAADKSVELVEASYRAGLTDFQNVLDAQRSRFVLQDDLASSEGQVVQNLVQLYRALGGGWPIPGTSDGELEEVPIKEN